MIRRCARGAAQKACAAARSVTAAQHFTPSRERQQENLLPMALAPIRVIIASQSNGTRVPKYRHATRPPKAQIAKWIPLNRSHCGPRSTAPVRAAERSPGTLCGQYYYSRWARTTQSACRPSVCSVLIQFQFSKRPDVGRPAGHPRSSNAFNTFGGDMGRS